MSGDEDKGFLGNLMNDLFGDDEEEESGGSGDGGSGGAGSGPKPNEGAEGAGSDDGGMSSEDDGGMCSEDDGSAALSRADGATPGTGRRVSENDDGPSGGLLESLATDISLWPHSIIRLIDAALGADPDLPPSPMGSLGERAYDVRLHYGLQDWFKHVDNWGQVDKGWAKFTFDGGIDLEGTWTPLDDAAPGTVSYDRGIQGSVNLWSSSSTWFEQSADLQCGVPSHNDESHGEDNAALAFQYEATITAAIDKSVNLILDFKAVFNAFEVKRKKGTTTWVRGGIAKIEATLSLLGGKRPVILSGPFGTFRGSLGIYAEVEVQPNYEKLLLKAIAEFGKDLGVDAGALISIPVIAVVGGVTSVVWGISELLDAWQMEDLHKTIVPECTTSATNGYMEGLHGTNEGDSGSRVSDADSAHDAYAAAGYKKRMELITQKCNNDGDAFDKWVNEHHAEIEKQARGEISVRVKQELFAGKADSYKSALLTNNGQALTNQYYAWVAIIGSSPKAMGGSWLTLWTKHRTFAADFPERSVGDW